MVIYLGPKLHPYVQVTAIGARRNFRLNCLIDTGFAGGIALPLRLKEKLKFPFICTRVWKLADGSEIELDVFAGKVKFSEKQKEIAVIFIGREEGIVGIEFLKGMRFVLDLKEKKVELS